MTAPMITTPVSEQTPDPVFDLDVSIVETGPLVTELLRMTDDGCGATCDSACANSTC